MEPSHRLPLPLRKAGRAYFFILAILCGLVVSGFFVNQYVVTSYRHHLEETFRVGQQRINVQRILLMATQLASANNYRERFKLQPQFINLRLRYSHWVRTHKAMVAASTGSPMQAMNEQLLEASTDFMQDVNELQQPATLTVEIQKVAHLADDLDRELLPAFEAVLAAHSNMDESSTRRMKIVEIGLITTLLLALGSQAVFIAWPAFRRLNDQKGALEAAHAKLTLRDCINPVSGLPNRRALEQHLAGVLETCQMSNILLVDIEIDDFRNMAEDAGPKAADGIQETAGARLSANTREGDFVADLGSGEFMVLMPDRDPKIAEDTAHRFKAILGEAFETGTVYRKVRAHVGYIAGSPASADASTLMHNAHLALKEARLRDSGNVLHYSDDMRLAAQRRDKISGELVSALQEGRIIAYFQPQLDLRTGNITGFEALARWDHPERGILTPIHFLDVADRTGLTEPIGETILAQSLQALNDWRAAGFDISSVGVNFSTNQLRDPGLTEKIKWEVERHGIEPGFVAIEVLESVPLLPESDQIVRNIRALAGFGFQIDLDDFGTGSTSVGHIRRLGANRIKLDRSLVKELDQVDERRTIASALIKMSEAMQIKVLAEGVETDGELMVLRSIGCDYVQGYGIARPMPFNATVPWLMDRANGRLDATTGPA